MPDKQDEMGALWARRTKENKLFLTGVVKINGAEYPAVCFKNDRKVDGETTPDWRIYKGRPREGQERGGNAPGPARQPAGSSGGRAADRPQGSPAARRDHELDDDIPF